jgi:hypothetical protein
MAWTVPMTFVANTVLTAAQMNTHLRDNLMETAPAKAVNPGGYFVTATENQIVERQAARQTLTDPCQSASTSYGDPETGTGGPQVTVTTGTRAWVLFGAEMWRTTDASNTNTIRMSVDVTGASTIAASDTRSLCNATPGQGRHQSSHAVWYDDLTPGENTFRCVYRVSALTGVWDSRRLIVLPY